MIDELLHVVARILLRALPPLTTHAALTRLGQLLPRRHSPEQVRRAVVRLRGHGTCLSRSLAIAARTRGVDVVIGVERPGPSTIVAHAWLEMEGRPIPPDDSRGTEIARLSSDSLPGPVRERDGRHGHQKVTPS